VFFALTGHAPVESAATAPAAGDAISRDAR
jgi:hypothetical protein